MPSASTPFNRWHHRVAVFIACATFVVIIAGALVTSEDAGLSVPDWPTSYGHYFRLPPWVGGIVFEHSHRVVAFFTIRVHDGDRVLDIIRGQAPLDEGAGVWRAGHDHRAGDFGRNDGAAFSSSGGFERPCHGGADFLLHCDRDSGVHRTALGGGSSSAGLLTTGIRRCSLWACCRSSFFTSN